MLPIVLTLSLTVIAGVALTAGACHLLLSVMPTREMEPAQLPASN
jgi:hypothetical protein